MEKGFINELIVNIPWKKNFSIPTVITINQIEIILSFIPEDKWEFIDSISIKSKLKMLRQYTKQHLDELKEKIEGEKNKNYLDKLLIKILDNLHIIFKNINIICKENGNSFSIKLDEIVVVNTNSNFEQVFIDRSKEGKKTNENDKVKQIFKLLKISGFSINLNINNESDLPIIKPLNLDVKITSNLYIDSKNNENKENALLNIFINLSKFDLNITQNHYSYIINLINFVFAYQQFQLNYYNSNKFHYFKPTNANLEHKIEYWKYIINIVKKQIKYIKNNDINAFKIPNKQLEEYKNNFLLIYPKFYYNSIEIENKKEITNRLSEEEINKLKEIVYNCEMKDLKNWTLSCLEKVYKFIKQGKNNEEEKENTFFGKFFVKKNIEVTSEEKEKIEELFQKINEEYSSIIVNQSENFPKLKIEFKLDEGTFKFIMSPKSNNNDKNNKIEEGFIINYKELYFSYIVMKKNSEMKIKSTLKDFGVSLFNSVFNNITTSTNITFKDENNNNLNDNFSISEYFFILSFNQNHISNELDLKIFSLNIIFNHVLIERIISFFSTKYLNENLSNKAYESFNKFKSDTATSLIENKNKINVVIFPRKFYLPINKFDIKTSKMIIFNTGKIQFTNEKEEQKKFILQLDSFTINYNNTFSVLERSSFKMNIYLTEKILVDFTIEDIKVNINSHILTLFIYFFDIFSPSQDIWATLNSNDKEIKSNAKFVKKIKKKNTNYLTWEEYFVVLSGGYIYFYKEYDIEKEQNYEGYFYLNDCHIIDNSNIIFMKNKYANINLLFEEENEKEEFKKIINERIVEMKIFNTELFESDENLIEINKKNKENQLIEGKIFFKNVSIFIYGNNTQIQEKENPLYYISSSKIQLKAKIDDLDTLIEASIKDVELADLGQKYRKYNPILCNKNLIENNNKEDTLFDIKISLIDIHSPNYKNIQYDVNIQIGYITLHWCPEIIKNLFSFVIHNDIEKCKIEEEIYSNSIGNNQNFLSVKDTNKQSGIKLKCDKVSYIYINMVSSFKGINIIWVQPILNIRMTLVTFSKSILEIEMKVDHTIIKGNLGNTEIFDLTNYPYKNDDNFKNIKSNDINLNKRRIFGRNIMNNKDKYLIKFVYQSLYNWCPLYKNDNYLSSVDVTINSVYLIYIHEIFIRNFTYFTNLFLGSISANKETKQFILDHYNITIPNERDIDFMKFNIKFISPKIILKPRYSFKDEYYFIECNQILIKENYQKIYGKLYNNPDEYRYLTTYQFIIENLGMKSQLNTNYELIKNINPIINIHVTEYTDRDLITYSNLEFDYSYQFDLSFNEKIFVNFKKDDFTKFFRILDLNILYTDYLDKEYDYLEFNDLINSKYNDTNKELFNKYNDIICNAFIKDIFLKLEIDEITFIDFEISFMLISLFRKLNQNKNLHFSIGEINAFYTKIGKENKEKFFMDNSSYNWLINEKYINQMSQKVENYKLIENLTSNDKIYNQINAKILIFSNLTKQYNITISNFKLLFQFNIIMYLYDTFINGFPIYTDEKNLPNDYSSNEEDLPGYSFLLEIKKPLISMLSTNLSIKEQENLCLTSEIIIGMNKEKISEIKNKIYNNIKNGESSNDNCFDIYSINVSFFDIYPYISQLNNEGKRKRKIIDNFLLSYETKQTIQIVDPENKNYLIKTNSNLNIEKISIRSSYTDIIFFTKIIKFNIESYLDINTLINRIKIENEKNNKKTKLDNKINKDIFSSNFILISQGLNLTLIDDHTNTLYPFLSISISESKLLYEYINKYSYTLNIIVVLKILCYNYYAGEWEPLLEKSKILIEIMNDSSDNKNISKYFHISSLPLSEGKDNIININLSDLVVSFLYRTLSNWIKKIKMFYNQKIDESIQKAKVSNHSIVNYTGKDINIYRKDILLTKLENGKSFDIEYFQSNERKNTFMIKSDINSSNINIITFNFTEKNLRIKNNSLKIDNMQIKHHFLEGNNTFSFINNNYNYIISKVYFKDYSFLKKFICFYSPITFKNKTQYTLLFNCSQKPFQTLNLEIKPNEYSGIPFEYINGNIHISLKNNNSNPKIFRCSSFLSVNKISDEIRFENIFLFFKKSSEEQVIDIIIPYSIFNCLPFDISLILNEQNEMYNIKKGENQLISCVSAKKILKSYIYIYNFHTNKDFIIFNPSSSNKTSNSIIKLYNNEKEEIIICTQLINDSKNAVYCIVFFARSLIINHTGLLSDNIKFYYLDDNDKSIAVANQIFNYNFFIFNDQLYKNLIIKYFGKGEIFTSNKISFNAIGTTNIIELINEKNKKSKIEFILEINLSLVDSSLDIFTNILKLVPKFIIYNKLKDDINMNMIVEKSENYNILSNSKIPLYNFNHDPLLDFIQIKPKNNKENYNYSSNVLLNFCSGFQTVKCYNKKEHYYKFINIEKKINVLSTYLILTEATTDNCEINIENFSKCIYCQLYQQGYQEDQITLKPKSKAIFAFNNLLDKKNLLFNFIDNNGIYFIRTYFYEINHEKDNFSEIITLKHPMLNSGHHILITFFSNDGCKYKIIITDYIENLTLYKYNTSEFNFSFPSIGISLIVDNRHSIGEKYKRKEICYITLDDIILYDKNVLNLVNGTIQNDIQIIIKEIEIDNEFSFIKNYPIILFSTKRLKDLGDISSNSSENNSSNTNTDNKNSTNSNNNTMISNSTTNINEGNPFFNFAMLTTMNNKNNIIKISLLNYLIQSFIFSVESNVVKGLLNFIQNITIELNTYITEINPIFLNHTNSNLQNNNSSYEKDDIIIKESYFMPEWITKTNISNIEEKEKLIFISSINLSPLEFSLTFQNLTKDNLFSSLLNNNNTNSNSGVLPSLLSTVSNIENVKIHLNGCIINNYIGNLNNLLNAILNIYKQNFMRKILKLLTSIDIIGDPLNLFSSLSHGVKDLFVKPAKGIMKGPLQGAIGLFDGTLSLAKNTVSGTLSSTSKITHGISKSFLLLSRDTKYINEIERKKIIQKPKNIFQGIGYGVSSLSMGVFNGVTDVIKKPIEGAKKENFKGFTKGIIKGLGGVVFKPISGVFDLVSKTTEGIKNNLNGNIKGKILPKRFFSRAFYGKYKIIKGFNEKHSQVINFIIGKINILKIDSEFIFNDCEFYNNFLKDEFLIVFTLKGIFIINLGKKELKFYIEYKNIKDVSIDECDEGSKINFSLNKKNIMKGGNYIDISSDNDTDLDKRIFMKIREFFNNYKNEEI